MDDPVERLSFPTHGVIFRKLPVTASNFIALLTQDRCYHLKADQLVILKEFNERKGKQRQVVYFTKYG